MMLIRELSGHSGCRVLLYKTKYGDIVRKISQNNRYNNRLKKQKEKQESFSSKYCQTPKIFEDGIVDGKYYFDMEFIEGKTLAESFDSMSARETLESIKTLMKIVNITKIEKEEFLTKEIFLDKINSVDAQITKKSLLMNEAFNCLRDFDFGIVPKSRCCGDLTLENILIEKRNGKIILIDFLDSFFDSWMIDVAKILQDIELGWSWRDKVNNKTRNENRSVALKYIISEIIKLDNGRKCLDCIYHILLLNILRIYPYTTDEATFAFLNQSIEKILLLINQQE